MVCVAGEVQGVLEIWDLSRGGDEPLKKTLEVSQSVRVDELVARVSCLCEHKIGSFGLILQWDRNKIELNDKDTRKLTEVGVDLSSPSPVMLLVTETAESPNAETGTKASTPTDDCPPATTSPITDQVWRWQNKKTEGDGGTERDQAESEEFGIIKFDSENFMTQDCTESQTKRIVRMQEYKNETSETETDDLFLRPRRKNYERTSKLNSKFKIGRAEQQGQDDNEPNQRSETAYVGLVNQAMTCYLNSLLQALYMTPEFRNALYNWEYVNGSEKDEAKSIPYQLQKLFLNLQTSTKNAIETTSLTKSFGWDSTEAWQQHDIQELCRVMFDALEQTFKKTEQADLINRLYEGKMIDYVKCLECGTEKSREDTFLDIPLPVKPFGSNVAYNSVEEALAAFVQPETLDGTNQYFCETCNKKCDAHKGLKFTKFPYLLTLHLKRFDFDYNTFHRIKLNDEVTFPDILNLNSFIPSTASQDSPCAEEDGGVGIKCDDSSTTDSGTLDDECPPCDNGMSVSDHSTNQDHDDDEGIDMSNLPSTSNCNTHNYDNEKNRGNRPEARGPYEYELFSIMIHSGSASGGHYYAYIKDFRTGEWLCFNDQNVSPITDDDIQKTYGGGPARAYYSGVYSSSTNAYMLMYRQIDPTRNTLPMQVAAFPKHLQELLVKMQECEYNEMKNREMLMQMYRLRVFCHRPNEKTLAKAKLFCLHDETWAELTERAYNTLCLDGLVDRDLVRLVTYQASTGLIECSFDGREQETLRTILEDQQDLLLEIRKKDEKFQTYLPGGLPTKVYVVDVAKKEVVKGPINVRGLVKQTVLEYKEQLGEILGMEPKDIQLMLQYPNNPTIRPVVNNDVQILFEGFSSANKIFVPTISDTDITKSIQDNITEIREVFGGLISLDVELPDTSKEALRALSIPSLEELTKDKPLETSMTNGTTKLSSATDGSTDTTGKPEASVTTVTTKVGGSDEVPGFRNETTSPSATQPEGEEWHTPEQSNSEDSSLSYSDRTLVGEGDASEDDDYPLANVDNEFFSQTEQDNWDIDDTAERFFKATRDEDDEKLLRVLVDKRMLLRNFKKLLEPYIGVPENYFKISRQCVDDTVSNRLTVPIASKFQEGDLLCVKLGRELRNGEYRVQLYQMELDSDAQLFPFLCECIVSKNATVGQTKKEILVELKRKFDIDIPFERCRLRRKNNKIASSVFLNDQKFKDVHHSWPFEIIVQELPGKEPVTDPNDVVLFVRRVMTPDAFLGPIEELVVSGKSIAEVREKLSEISGIPEEYLEMAKGKSPGTGSRDMMMIMFDKVLEWNRQSSQTDNHPPYGLEDGSFIYYRDWREKATAPVTEDSQYDVTSKAKSRLLGISSSPRYSPRRERALKIYVDDK